MLERAFSFCIKISRNIDPACGTGRFLIHAMDDMISKVNQPTIAKRDEKKIFIKRHQLHGADIDMRIAKIAKMNMWIHGDGKTNIKGEVNGITLHRLGGFNGHDSYDNSFDIVLTNPPLGELNYQTATFTDLGEVKDRLARIPVLPIKNKTEERRDLIAERINHHSKELDELIELKNKAEEENNLTQRELNSLKRKIQNKTQTIENNQAQLRDIESMLTIGISLK